MADAAIPHLEKGLSGVAELERLPGRSIDTGSLEHADALLVRSVTRVDMGLLDGTPVKFVGSATIGTDHVAVPELVRAGVGFAHAAGCNAEAVAEYVITAIYHAAAIDEERWADCPVGVIGFGNTGRRVTRHLRGLGRTVLVNDPPLAERRASPPQHGSTDTREATACEEPLLPLEDLLARCGVISIHVPHVRTGSHPTVPLLDDALVRDLLHAGTLVINTSRGGVVAERPLLTDERPAGRAVIDVWEGEPRLRWALLDPARSVILATPHIAGYSVQGKRQATRSVLEGLFAHFGVEATPTLPSIKPIAHPLRVDRDLPPAAAFARVLTDATGLPATDRALRSLIDRPDEGRATGYDALRDGYVLRQEFSSWTFRGDDAVGLCLGNGIEIQAALRGLGFSPR